MELFLEFASTVVLTILLCYIIGKLISTAQTGDYSKGGDRKMGVFQCEFSVESGIHSLKSEGGRVGFVEKVMEVDESEVERFAVEGMPGIRNVSKIGAENGGEGDRGSGGGGVEEESLGCGRFSERADNVFDERSERDIIEEIEVCLSANDEMGLAKCDEIEVTDFDEGEKEEEEDDWVGIERTELERLFGAAMVYVMCTSNAERVSVLDNDVKMKLYGLRKIATQGPCLQPQPMALKVSARAKWNAWQQLGEMTPEMAMEQYISLLSESIPGWMQDESGKDGKQDFIDAREFGKPDVLKQNQPVAGDKRKLEELKSFH